MEGLPAGSVFLVDHDDRWRESFREEAELLRKLLGPKVVAVEHIGSTAVPGLKAKPLVDLLVGLDDLGEYERFDFNALAARGYCRLRNAAVEGKRVIAKFRQLDPPVKTHVVHVVVHGGDWWQKHLLFRDRLRENPEIAGDYERLKLGLAERHPGDERAYADAKLEFVERVLSEK
ncbi:dephospho-CoA kinase/protein folding accessory domain-containing protein [Bhargavaea cecembensis DSE10]|uniref:Dephospho-CoA kinase/protein folding accessory domain-containing protein n=1 Tax=Bhargavaea cecembensis DSE10 TaxID=1235279 RepID=M7NGR3_9BACL|nr:GrpB family protein [Bhargavaea cecembensis]EMR06371.1 dephospho-CoA kinase/protein folding accessory domain-containing protein [Bhargavaea cecembensis DSE10]